MGKAARRKWESRAKWSEAKQANLKTGKYLRRLLAIAGDPLVLGIDRFTYEWHRTRSTGNGE